MTNRTIQKKPLITITSSSDHSNESLTNTNDSDNTSQNNGNVEPDTERALSRKKKSLRFQSVPQFIESAIVSSSDDDDLDIPNNRNNANRSVSPGTKLINSFTINRSYPHNFSHTHPHHNRNFRTNEGNKDTKNHLYNYNLNNNNNNNNNNLNVATDSINLMSLHDLPAFKKRPLSDTPFGSRNASPVLLPTDDSDKESDNHNEDDFDSDLDLNDNRKKNNPDNHKNNINHISLSSSKDPLKTKINNVSSNNNNNNNNNNNKNKNKKKTTKNKGNEIDFSSPASLEKLDKVLNEHLNKKHTRRATTLDVPGLTKSKTSPDGTIANLNIGSKLVVVMVGLPARGKSYITNKLTRYLNWSQHNCRVFNVGNTRRKDDAMNLGPASKPLSDSPSPENNSKNNSTNDLKNINTKNHDKKTTLLNANETATIHDANFFSPLNKKSKAIREKWAMDTLDQLLDYIIDGPGSVGIFDATNTTKSRRQKILNKISKRSNNQLKVLFLESICDDPALLQKNMRLKLSGPDYKKMDPTVALKDFTERLHNYEKVYETIDQQEEDSFVNTNYQYIKMINVGRKIVSFNIQGFLASQTVYFLLNFNLAERMIWITRHGESFDNIQGKIGGDSELTARGLKFSKALAKFIAFKKEEFRKKQIQNFKDQLINSVKFSAELLNGQNAEDNRVPQEPTFSVWTSMLKRSVQTAQYFNENEFFIKEMKMLDELGSGKMDGKTYQEIQDNYPEEFQARIDNKMTYRYPGLGGESYLDVINRLKPIITETERSEDHIMIVSHRVVCRILLAYFMDLDKKEIGRLDIPLHSCYVLTPKPYGVDWELYEFNEKSDWFDKVDKFKYTRLLKQISINYNEKRKYSVVPTLPSDKLKIRNELLSPFINMGSNLNSGYGTSVATPDGIQTPAMITNYTYNRDRFNALPNRGIRTGNGASNMKSIFQTAISNSAKEKNNDNDNSIIIINEDEDDNKDNGQNPLESSASYSIDQLTEKLQRLHDEQQKE
ncbi:6-phosphofructo-2-kinase [Ascoidea rubescens DSM 1968]|uniref:6PF2K-domain-containing protein n=1 Tax=Ascoidea rubescens DSM 1968 TaxID=1344418 RepID=A0A1D2VS23_9ASCO|nr:6PF2K-domain-containing protein [Ascoidea rubescens DSM 1968]ODV64399.1 6PF2K-domain-containing protein [Ascoidea rubescens DSM 1968]